MSSIPLAALSVRPPTIPDPLEQMGRIGALKSQQQGIQAGNMALKDEQAMTAAMQSWDGSDPNQLPGLVIKNGGSAKAVLGLKSQLLAQKKSYSEIAKDDAETGKNNLDSQIKRNDQMAGLIGNILQVPDEQLPQAVQQAGQQALQQGLLDQQHAQGIGQLTQMPPDQMRQKLTFLQKSFMGQKAQQEAAQAQATMAKDTAQAGEANASAANKTAEGKYYAANGGAPGVPQEAIQMNDWLKKNPGKTSSDYGIAMKKIVPAYNFSLQGGGATPQANDPIVQAVANGTMKIADAITPRTPYPIRQKFLQSVMQANPSFDSRNYDIEKGVMKEFTSGDAAKNLTAFNTAIEHAGQLQKATDALDNGDIRGMNKIGNALGYQFGSDKTTNFNVIKNALSGEISKVFKGGQATDAEIHAVQAPFDAANSPAQLKGAIQSAISLMNSKRDALKQQYSSGKNAQPNFGNDQGQTDPFAQFGGAKKQ